MGRIVPLVVLAIWFEECPCKILKGHGLGFNLIYFCHLCCINHIIVFCHKVNKDVDGLSHNPNSNDEDITKVH
jgi:hypothetical protein